MSSGYAIIDTETTGLHPGYHHRIIELAVVHLDDTGKVTGEWCSLFNPERDLGPQRLHGISAAEVRRAPTFTELAGDIVERLTGRVLVAHNLSFDLRFLAAEFRRAEIEIESTHASGLCTMHLAAQFLPLAGRSLAACCRAAEVAAEHAHSALHDAQAAARLMMYYIQAAGRPVPWRARMVDAAMASWPVLATGKAVPVQRRDVFEPQPNFLARLVDRLPSVPSDPRADEYLGVLDSALIDRYLSESEQDELLDVASDVGLTVEQVIALHRRYLQALASIAWADGVLTPAERADLQATAELLGLAEGDVEGALAEAKIEADVSDQGTSSSDWGGFALSRGDLVVFTGEMTVTREEWSARAAAAGLHVNGGNVTKETRLLVAADPDSLSGKARKAHKYKIPIVTEEAFGEMLSSLKSE